MHVTNVAVPVDARASRLVAPMVALVAVAGVGAFFGFRASPEALRETMLRWEFWLLEALFVSVVVTTAIEARRLHVDRRLLVRAAWVGLAAGLLAAVVPPRTNRIYYDEHIYQGVAQNLTDLHRAQMCNDGAVEYGRLQCWRAEFNKEPNGYPYVLSLVYRVIGVTDRAAFVVNNVVNGLTAFVVVLIAWLLFADRRGALFAGIIIALLPMQLWWTNTAAAEPSAALWTAAAFLAVVHTARVRTRSSKAWMVTLAAFAMAFRPESIFIAPLAAVTLALLAPVALRAASTWWAAVAGAALALPSLQHLIAVRNEAWGAPVARFSLQFVSSNLPANFWFYFGNDDRFPWLIAVAAVAGVVVARPFRAVAALGIYFLLYWGVFIFFYAGSYYYGADVRYSVLSHVPLALLAGACLGRLSQWLSYVGSGFSRSFVSVQTSTAVVTAAVLLQFSWSMPVARAVGEEAWGARADVRLARQFADRLPPNAVVLSHNPGLFQLWGISAAQLSLVQTDPAYIDRLFERYAGGVYAHWSFWCNVKDPQQTAFCNAAIARYPNELVASGNERDYVYRLYKLSTRRDTSAP